MSDTKKPKIFISYSHEDEEWKDFIELKLQALNCFDIWYDRDIRLGEEWFRKIKEETYKTNIVVMLVSDHFLTSDFIEKEEIPVFVERAKNESIMLVPLIISSCAWEEYNWLSSRQGYPIDNNPLDLFQVQHHLTFDKCPKISKQATIFAKRVKKEYFDDCVKDTIEVENNLDKIVTYLIRSKITPKILKSTAKPYLEPLYQRELASKTTLRDIIDYLDNHNKNPLYCIVKELFENDDTFIEEWLDKNSDTECKKVVIDKEDLKDRIIVDFEPVAGRENNNKYNIYINYYFKGRFKANQEPTFKNLILKDDSIQDVKKELLDILYDEVEFYEHIDFILPKKLLLLDIKLWSIEDEVNYIKKCFINNIKITFHIRERLDFRGKIWSLHDTLLDKTIGEALSIMEDPKDECKDNSKIGLKYHFVPNKTLYENFFDRVKRKPIAIRCTKEDDLENYKNWMKSKDTIQIKDLKEEIDKEECKCITLIWDDPNIPLKPKEGVTQ